MHFIINHHITLKILSQHLNNNLLSFSSTKKNDLICLYTRHGDIYEMIQKVTSDFSQLLCVYHDEDDDEIIEKYMTVCMCIQMTCVQMYK